MGNWPEAREGKAGAKLASLKPAQNNAPTEFSGLIALLGSLFLMI